MITLIVEQLPHVEGECGSVEDSKVGEFSLRKFFGCFWRVVDLSDKVVEQLVSKFSKIMR